MKARIILLACLVAVTAGAQELPEHTVSGQAWTNDVDAQTAQVRQDMLDALEFLQSCEKERAIDAGIVETVYHEGTNSSFITRTELTATQKRFLQLGRHFMSMAFCLRSMEARIKALEDEKAERDGKLLVLESEREKRREEARQHKKDAAEKVRRAIERNQTGAAMKRNRCKKEGK